jgi:hypothetical protein
MIKKKTLPTEDFELNSQDSTVQKMVIDFCRNNGVPVYEGTKGFDPRYPILCWSPHHKNITQRPSHVTKIVSVEEFLQQFFSSTEPIKVGTYDVMVDNGDEITVGCQSITFEQVQEVYMAMKEYRK